MKSTRWAMVMLAFVGIIICYMDRAALAYAIKPLEQVFHLNNKDFGLLSSFFAVGYLIMVFLGGILVDYSGARMIWTISAFIWSIATILIGFSSGLTMLIILRLVLGLAEGPSFPALTRATTDWLPLKERNRALALGLAAVPFASVVGAPLTTHLLANYGWQFMFIFLGSVGVVWSLLWLLLFRNQPQQSKLISKKELTYLEEELAQDKHITHSHSFKSNWKFILTNKTFLINNYAFFSFGYLLFFGITWLPGYLEQSFHLHIKKVGLFLTLPWLLATLAMLFNGWFSDWLWSKTKSLRISRSLLIAGGLILSSLCFIPAIMATTIHSALVFMSLALALGLMPNSSFYALNADLAPDMAGTSLGVMDTFLAFAGIIAPLLTGYLSNLTGNFKVAIGIMFALNISAGLLVLFFQNPDKDLANKKLQLL